MRYLLDTHVLLWFTIEPARMSARATEVLVNEQVELLWSQASTWEIAVKVGLGKLSLPAPLREWLPSRAAQLRLRTLGVSDTHAFEIADLPHHHRDPFDRMLVAQARIERATLVSADPAMRSYDVEVLW